jgi:hypothetical protein
MMVVIVGADLELWSVSRSKGGFSCLRTVHAGTAVRAWAAIAATGIDARRLDDPRAIDALLQHLPLAQPSANAGAWVVTPLAALAFFVAGRSGEGVLDRARRLVREVAPILTVAA